MWRALGPAMSRIPAREALRASSGALIAIGLVSLFLLSPEVDTVFGLYLVAPFGATAVMVFAIPNSPLAQPWSAIVGNMLGASIGVSLCYLVPEASLRVALAVGGTIFAMAMLRALHPPAGGVAMVAALHPEEIFPLGFWFVLTPIGLGATALVLMAMLHARLTGRRYPFRQYDGPGRPGASVRDPSDRVGLSEAQLGAILERYRQSFNLGAEDLARLIGAAQMEAVAQSSGPMTAADVMSRDLVTVGPDTPLAKVAALFRAHRFATLPVVGPDGLFRGIIYQLDLISRASEDARLLRGRFELAMRRLAGQGAQPVGTAQEVMTVKGPRVAPTTPLGALLPMMADGATDAVPVVDSGRIVGVVTRADLLAVLSRRARLTK